MSENTKTAVRQFYSRVWVLVLLRGIAVLILGLLLIAKPGLTALWLVRFMGAYFLVDGGFAVIKSITARKQMPGWGWGVLMGSLELLTGVFVFAHPITGLLITASVLVYSVAFLAILFGVLGVVNGIHMIRELSDRAASLGGGAVAMIAAGVLAIIFGVILIMNPKETATIYLTVMGIIAVIGGLVQIIAAIQVRHAGKKAIERQKT